MGFFYAFLFQPLIKGKYLPILWFVTFHCLEMAPKIHNFLNPPNQSFADPSGKFTSRQIICNYEFYQQYIYLIFMLTYVYLYQSLKYVRMLLPRD